MIPQIWYTPLIPIPEELLLNPMAFGTTTLPAAKIKDIQDELANRFVEDQAVQKDPKRISEAGKVMGDNTAYLTDLVKEFG